MLTPSLYFFLRFKFLRLFSVFGLTNETVSLTLRILTIDGPLYFSVLPLSLPSTYIVSALRRQRGADPLVSLLQP